MDVQEGLACSKGINTMFAFKEIDSLQKARALRDCTEVMLLPPQHCIKK